jgi:glutamine amidotransferase
MAAYLGESAKLSLLTGDSGHSLHRQSYAAQHLQGAVVSADGWGAAWYLPEDGEPCLYRSTMPIWADVNRTHMGRAARSHCLLAAVRSATDPLSVSHANTQPFASGALTLLHNGFIERFATQVMRSLRSALSDAQYACLRGSTDSEHLLCLISDEYLVRPELPGPDRLLVAVQRAIGRVRELAEAKGVTALLTMIVADGENMVGLRSAIGDEPPSLYVKRDGSEQLPGCVLASEPLNDEPGWSRLPSGGAVLLSRHAEARELRV